MVLVVLAPAVPILTLFWLVWTTMMLFSAAAAAATNSTKSWRVKVSQSARDKKTAVLVATSLVLLCQDD